jgi:hypothetical protein
MTHVLIEVGTASHDPNHIVFKTDHHSLTLQDKVEAVPSGTCLDYKVPVKVYFNLE